MNAVDRAKQLRDALVKKDYPFLGAEIVLEIGSPMTWPLVQAWDDTLEALILVACVDHDNQLIDALAYARAVANQDVFGAITLCYALGQQAFISEFGTEISPNVSHILAVTL